MHKIKVFILIVATVFFVAGCSDTKQKIEKNSEPIEETKTNEEKNN